MVNVKFVAKFKVIISPIPQIHVLKFVEMENFMIINVMMETNLMEMDALKIVSSKKIGVVIQMVLDQYRYVDYKLIYKCL